MLLKDTCETARAIMAGELDSDLEMIRQAVAARQKARFRKGARVKLVGTKNPEIDGKEGVILKVNARTVSVGLGEKEVTDWGTFYKDGEFNCPPAMVEVI